MTTPACTRTDLRLPGGRPKWAAIPIRINHLYTELRLRGAQQKCSHNPYEICTLHTELRLRDIPRKSVQRRRHSQRLYWPGHGFTGQDPPRRKIVRIAPTPCRLLLPPTGQLTLRPATGMLPGTYSIIRTEPTMTDATGTLPANGHDETSSPRTALSLSCNPDCRQVGLFWKASPGQFSKAPKQTTDSKRITSNWKRSCSRWRAAALSFRSTQLRRNILRGLALRVSLNAWQNNCKSHGSIWT